MRLINKSTYFIVHSWSTPFPASHGGHIIQYRDRLLKGGPGKKQTICWNRNKLRKKSLMRREQSCQSSIPSQNFVLSIYIYKGAVCLWMCVTFYVTCSIINNSAIWGMFREIVVSMKLWGLGQHVPIMSRNWNPSQEPPESSTTPIWHVGSLHL